MAPWKDCGRLVAVALSALSVCLGCSPEAPLEKFGITGGAVTLEPKVNVGTRLDDVSWKKNEDLVAELEDRWTASRFEGRAKLDPAKGSLTIARLQASDSGEYRAEVNVGGEIQCTFFSLRILATIPPQYLAPAAAGPPPAEGEGRGKENVGPEKTEDAPSLQPQPGLLTLPAVQKMNVRLAALERQQRKLQRTMERRLARQAEQIKALQEELGGCRETEGGG